MEPSSPIPPAQEDPSTINASNQTTPRSSLPVLGRDKAIYRFVYTQTGDNGETEKQWIRRSTKQTKHHIFDSIVHRFGREVGFREHTVEEAQSFLNHHDTSRFRIRQQNHNILSAKDRGGVQSQFEHYVLNMFGPRTSADGTEMPAHPYYTFLQKLQDHIPDAEPDLDGRDPVPHEFTIPFEQPTSALVEKYCYHLCSTDNIGGIASRGLKYNAVRAQVGSLSGTCAEFGIGPLKRAASLKQLIEKLRKEYFENRAPAFFPEEALPRLYLALFNPNYEVNRKKKVEIWARLLVQMACIARSSCVTADRCPKFHKVKFPQNKRSYYSDGLPHYVDLVWNKWKSRPTHHNHRDYHIRLYANPFDKTFCPVHWLFEHWTDSGHFDHPENADKSPNIILGIFQSSLTSDTWRNTLRTLFHKAGYKCSSHSIRRSAAMWASRCGLGFDVIKDIGRWASSEELSKYLAEGRILEERKYADDEVGDHLIGFWILDVHTRSDTMSVMGTSASVLRNAEI